MKQRLCSAVWPSVFTGRVHISAPCKVKKNWEKARWPLLLGDDARKELRRIVVVGADVLVRGT
jgi:hypothetical protein